MKSFLETEQTKTQSVLSSVAERSEALIKELEGYRDKAHELLHVIGSTGMAGEYQKAAASARHSGWFWQFVTVVSMGGLIAFAIWAFTETQKGDFNWTGIGTRAFVAVAFGILAAFAIRQTDRYMETEQRNRRYQLELSSIDPYLVGLPEETQHQVKVELVERLFGNAAALARRPKQEATGTSLDVIRVAIETLQEMVKKS